MKIKKALSITTQQIITPVRADELYWQGIITSKYAFQCPDRNCSAEITCANLDKEVHLRKIAPYYRVIGEHAENCQISADIRHIQQTKTRKRIGEYNTERTIDKLIIRLNTSNLDNAIRIFNEAATSCEQCAQHNDFAKKDRSKYGQRQQTMVLSDLVDAFFRGCDVWIELPSREEVHIQDFFIELAGQNIEKFPEEMRCYYGAAWLNYNEDKGSYSFNFSQRLTLDREERRTSFLLPNELIEASSYSKFEKRTLRKSADKKLKDVFIISKPKPSKNRQYINFSCESFEYLDYREM